MKRINFPKMLLWPLKLYILSLLIGILGGLVGAAFSHLLSFVTGLREAAPWLVLLLPIGGVAIVVLYRIFGMEEYGKTNKIIQCLKNKEEIKAIAAPLIFVSTAITHLFGGSAGREGAAIQLGGAGASAVSNVFRLKNDQRTALIMSGMSAVFAGVFGTPLTAAFFILEFRSSRKTFSLAILPCFIAAIVAKTISSLMGVAEETVHLNHDMPFSFSSLGKVIVLSVALSLLGVAMCFIFDKAEVWAEKVMPNSFLRVVLGAMLIVALTAVVGDMRYNGSGMNMAIAAVEGKADWFDFILKIVFTAITLSAGFKGGEIVPTFCVGATFGCVFGGILGLDVGLSAALGLIGLFCCATNSPLSAMVLGIEMFGLGALPYFIVICIILWLLSVNNGLFENRFFKSPILVRMKK